MKTIFFFIFILIAVNASEDSKKVYCGKNLEKVMSLVCGPSIQKRSLLYSSSDEAKKNALNLWMNVFNIKENTNSK